MPHGAEDRLREGRRPARFDTAALVDREIENHGAAAHLSHGFLRDEYRGAFAGHEHRADENVRVRDRTRHGDIAGVDERYAPAQRPLRGCAAAALEIEHRHLGAESREARGSVRTQDAGAQNDDFGGSHSGNAGQQDATAAARRLEQPARELRTQASGDLAHGGQDRAHAVAVEQSRRRWQSSRGRPAARRSRAAPLPGAGMQRWRLRAQQMQFLAGGAAHLEDEIAAAERLFARPNDAAPGVRIRDSRSRPFASGILDQDR
jgi:hypothetical protein